MSIDILRALQPRTTNGRAESYLTIQEWAEVFKTLERGVPLRDIFEAFARQRGYTTFRGFQSAYYRRREIYAKQERTK